MDAESSYPMWDVMGKFLIIGIILVLVIVAFIAGFNFVNNWLLDSATEVV